MADDLGGLFFRYNLRMIPLSGDEYAAEPPRFSWRVFYL